MWRRTFERRGTYIFISESVLVTIFATRKISPVFAWRLYLEADGFQHGSADVLSGNVQYDIKVQFGKTEIICLNIHICFNRDNFSQPWQMISFRPEGSVIATLLYVLSCRTRFPLHRTWERASQEFGVKKNIPTASEGRRVRKMLEQNKPHQSFPPEWEKFEAIKSPEFTFSCYLTLNVASSDVESTEIITTNISFLYFYTIDKSKGCFWKQEPILCTP